MSQIQSFAPFFFLYLVIFVVLTISENLALSLFVETYGAEKLPIFYKYTAVISMASVILYLKIENRVKPFRLLSSFLLLISLPFIFILTHDGHIPRLAIGMAFICKEIGFLFVFLHFGSILQSYFRKDHLTESIPFIYSGGRIGAVVGGIVVLTISQTLGVYFLTIGLFVFLLLYGVMVRKLSRSMIEIERTEDLEERTFSEVYNFISRDRFLQWLIVSSFLFMVCRWFLNYQSTAVLETLHKQAIDVSVFMGYYTTVAMSFSLIIQMFFLTRMIRRYGLTKVDMLYNLTMVVAFLITRSPHSIASFAAMRFAENELRFAVRNPLNQIFSNVFSRKDRTIARTLIIALTNPIAALSSGALIAIGQSYSKTAVFNLGFFLLTLYIISCHYRYKYFKEKNLT